MRIVFLSNGPNRTLKMLDLTIQFKHILLKNTKYSFPQSEIIVQALRELGEEHITSDTLKTIRQYVSVEERKKLKDTKFVTS